MRVFVKAKPRAKHASVKRIEENRFEIAVRAAPQDGKANDAILRALAEHLGVARSRIRLIAGASAKQKVFEITDSKSKS